MAKTLKPFVTLLLVALLSGCAKEISELSASLQTPKQKLLAAAKAIASDPSNWRSNSQRYTDFSEAAVALDWTEKPQVIDFKASVLDLITFSTTWIDTLNQAENQKFREGVTHIFASVDSEAPAPQGSAHGRVDMQDVQKRAETALSSSTSKLQAAQAEQFGKIFRRVMDSYERIYKLAGTAE